MKTYTFGKEDKFKRATRNNIFNNYFYNYRTLIGLPGPNIVGYIKDMRRKGFRNLHLWEKSKQTHYQQVMAIQENIKRNNGDFSLHLGDILDAPAGPDILYDLDFCCNIHNVKKHVLKFLPYEMVLTVSERPNRKWTPLFEFAKIVQGNDNYLPVIGERNENEAVLHLESGETWVARRYCDTTPMVVIHREIPLNVERGKYR